MTPPGFGDVFDTRTSPSEQVSDELGELPAQLETSAAAVTSNRVAAPVGIRINASSKCLGQPRMGPFGKARSISAAIEEAQRPLRPYVALCAFAGLRQGEANGLQVGDIDFLRRTCRSRARSKQFRSECSRRASQGGIQAGHLHPRSPDHAAQSTHRVARHQGDEGWLFGTPAARLNRNSSGNLWRRLRARCGLEQFTLHDLRHFYASGLIAAGCDVVTVQRALGHSAPSITLDTYAHLWPSAEDRTRKASAGLMDAAFRRPGETATKD